MSKSVSVPVGAAFDTNSAAFGGALSAGIVQLPAGVAGSGMTWTVECWFKRNGVPSGIEVVLGSTGFGYIGVGSSGSALFNVATGNATIAGSASICDGEWHHLRYGGDATTVHAFVDGVPVGTATAAQGMSSAAAFGLRAFENGGFPTGGELDEVAFWTACLSTTAFAVPTAPYVGTEANLAALYHLDGDCINGALVTPVAPDARQIAFSPWNWNVTAASARTNAAGAYLRFLFTGQVLALDFDASLMVTPGSEIYWRVDGYAGSDWTRATIQTPGDGSTTCRVIARAAADLCAAPYHLLEMVVKSTTETANRWEVGVASTAVVLSGITLQDGQGIAPTGTLNHGVLIYEDSIGEGVRTVNQTAALDTDRNDARLSWAFNLGAALGAEIGMACYGGVGFTVGGSGGVPALPSSWNMLDSATVRSFRREPSLVVVALGSNDGDNDVTAAVAGVLDGLIMQCPRTPIALVRPFAGAVQLGHLRAAAAACSAPSHVTVIDTAAVLDPSFGIDGLGLHPLGPNDIALVTPAMAGALRSLLDGGIAPMLPGIELACPQFA